MASMLIIFAAVVLLPQTHVSYCKVQPWIRSAYWLTVSEYPVPELDSSLFTHLLCAFAGLNSTTYQLSIPSSDQQYFASFTATVKLKNPSIQTLLSIGDSRISPTFMSMISNSSSRNSFIKSSIETATTYGFNGLDICCFQPNTTSNSLNMAALFDEWRSAVDSNKVGNHQKLILTMGLYYSPTFDHVDDHSKTNLSYPVESIQRNFDWVHIMTLDYFVPLKDKFAHPHASLYDPYHAHVNTDYSIRQWINKGLSANKILIGLPYHGWAWTLLNPNDHYIGAPASGPGITADGSMSYKYIKGYVQSYKANIVFNSTYVENTCSFGSFWVGFDDVDAIRIKVSYAKDKGLRGYNVFQVGNDDNWVLSRAAAQIKGEDQLNKKLLLIKVLAPLALISGLATLLFFFRTKLLGYARTLAPDVKSFSTSSPDLKVFRFMDISAATNDFSCYNKLGEGGYGPVYKGKLRKGQEIAVKRLSKASSQGFEEFKNEVMLTARLQHVNLVRVMGFCLEREEKMLIYEYLPNKSLDLYLFDPLKRLQLDWEKRADIVEGIIQGLLYLQEYSRLTIIHRDLKPSNILLDKELRPKISDFGMARIFQKDEYEANTSRIVGTYGCVPPEYLKQGVYSTKYDVYSFGVLLLQIISGKRNNYFYGVKEDLNLSEYAYELWVEGQGVEFTDSSLDDSCSKYKLMRCMQIALLCVQEKQDDRPSMLDVSSMLKNETELTIIPKRPAFSMKAADDAEQNTSSRPQDMCSSYYSEISELEPR